LKIHLFVLEKSCKIMIRGRMEMNGTHTIVLNIKEIRRRSIKV
jgi:hypothetical protein